MENFPSNKCPYCEEDSWRISEDSMGEFDWHCWACHKSFNYEEEVFPLGKNCPHCEAEGWRIQKNFLGNDKWCCWACSKTFN